MSRKILLITTDQQRYDALGCNGGAIARTPVVDGWAADGIRYTRAHNQNVVCMPARSTIISGQYPRTHGCWMNGVPLPDEHPNVVYELAARGYHTALLGKAHFQPVMDPKGRWTEGRLARENRYGPYRGFEHCELVMHGSLGPGHYPKWLAENHPEEIAKFYPQVVRDDTGAIVVNHAGGGDTGACQVVYNGVPRDLYHTDWVADRTIAYLDSLADDTDWFVWMSFPDPHHPWDPPASEKSRVDWRDLELPAGYPGSPEACREILAKKPRHWLDAYEGRSTTSIEMPPGFVPAAMTADQIREINALVHVENELIDEACGRVMARVRARGWDGDTDVFFTTDHGELQGDFGMLFKGPYHVEALMHVPLIWRPAPNAGVAPAEVPEPVGHIDLAPTFCEIAGLEAPEWMEGTPLPQNRGSDRSRVLTEWDCLYRGTETHLRTIYRDGWVCTTYEAGSAHDGSEGELYDLAVDPHQFENRWHEPEQRAWRDELVADISAHFPPAREQWPAPEALV